MQTVYAGLLFHESNTFNQEPTTTESFLRFHGNEGLDRLASVETLRAAGVRVVGGEWAMALSSGPVSLETFEELSGDLLRDIENSRPLDGIVLHLHGTMLLEDGRSADTILIQKLRQVVGADVPITLAMDPHGNLALELVSQVNGICAYNTIPHVDQASTEVRAAKLLLARMAEDHPQRPVFVSIPMMIGGDSAIDSMESLQSIYAVVNDAIRQRGALDGNFFVGFSWADTPTARSSVVLNPVSEDSRAITEQWAKAVATQAWAVKDEFVYSERAFDLADGIRWAAGQTGRVVLADTGDNTTGGAPGSGTIVAQHLLSSDAELNGKRVCVGPILAPEIVERLHDAKIGIGAAVSETIGAGTGQEDPVVEVDGVLLAFGDMRGYLGSENESVGRTVTIRAGLIDVVLSDSPSSFVTPDHFTAAGLEPGDYDIVVVKQGYIFPKLHSTWPKRAFLLTPGATDQNFDRLQFRRRQRPLYPFEAVGEWTPTVADVK